MFPRETFCSYLAKGNKIKLGYRVICLLLVLSVIIFLCTIDFESEPKIHKIETSGKTEIYPYQPQQVHLAFDSSSDIVVTWSTLRKTKGSFVEFGIETLQFTQKSTAKAKKFVDGGSKKRTQFIHRVTLWKLLPNSTYVYRCGCVGNWSQKLYWFHTPPNDSTAWTPTLAIFGDLGLRNGVIFPKLLQDTQSQMYDAIIHNGDMAYDMKDQNGEVGDEFMRKIEDVAAHVPYMTSPGNHEKAYDFLHYRERFSMPGDSENLFYSFDLGPVHFIGFSTELYYYFPKNAMGAKQIIKQYNWLKRNLQMANKPEHRVKQPWIVTFGHSPMYCSGSCIHYSGRLREGRYGLEELFYSYGVDVEIWAHQHRYERLWPVYNKTVFNGSFEAPYFNPIAPVHIITGAAGNWEGNVLLSRVKFPWSAFLSLDYSFTRMKAYNESHLYFEQVSATNSGQITQGDKNQTFFYTWLYIMIFLFV